MYQVARCALVLYLWFTCGGGLWTALFSAGEPFKFYTYQSNLLAFLMLTAELCLLVVSLLKRRAATDFLCLPPVIKGWVAVTILLTFFTYWTVLSGFAEPAGRQDAIVHFIVPLGVVAEYLLFHSYGKHRWYEPLCWCVSPVAYCIFVAVMYLSQNYFNGDYFPYFFMDFISYGWQQVALTGVCLLAFFIGCGYLFYLWDRVVTYFKNIAHRPKEME